MRTPVKLVWAGLAAGLVSGCQRVPAPQPPAPPVTVSHPVETSFPDFIQETGTTAASRTVNLTARVEGTLQKVYFKDGSYVSAGAPLFLIEPAQYEAKVALSQAQLLSAQAEFDRQQRLIAQQATSQASVENWRSQRDVARANVELARIDLGYARITAPFPGRIGRRLVDQGNVVGAPGAPTQLATLEQIAPIYAYFNINERDLLKLRETMAAQGIAKVPSFVPVEAALQSDNGYDEHGALNFVDTGVDPGTGALQLRAEFPNTDRHLLPGLFVRVRIPVGSPARALAVPETAVGRDQAGAYVLVVDDRSVVQQRRITLGRLEGGLRAAPSGLVSTDRVIVDGLMNAAPGWRVSAHEEPVPRRYVWAGNRPMISKYFIDHPVLANVIALLIVLAGAVALINLPISQYPAITPPTVQVIAHYPGGNAKTLVQTVALPIEQQVNGVDGMLYMQSTSSNDGSYTLTVTFKIGTDLDNAQVQVQNRVNAALAQLPQAAQQQGVTVKKASTAILQIITLTSPDRRFDSLFLSNYATINLRDKLARLPGVGDVNVFGIGQYSMRIWLDPNQLQARGLTPKDVINAIRAQNQSVAGGQLGMPPAPAGQPNQFTVNIAGEFDDVSQFEDIIIKSNLTGGGAVTRVRDVARVELGAQSYSQFLGMDGKPAAGIAIYQVPSANALEVAKAVDAAMAQSARAFPPGLAYSIPFDTTLFVKASVKEVYVTLVEAALLVLLVIIVFLQDWRATLVPATTVPVTLIGAFAVMSMMGFSINLLTLFAIVLAIGIVVDDAIVVVEGVARHIEHGLAPREASILAMDELLGPIIGITLVLMSVFLPASFMPGLTGQMYRQFALVIAATAIISAINAVTLKPTQCALWLRPRVERRKNAFFRAFDAVYFPIERGYSGLIGRLVAHSGWAAVIGVLLVIVAGLGLSRIPTGFIPVEDQGYLILALQLPDAASLERTQKVVDEVTDIARTTPGVAHAVAIGGVSVLDNNASVPNDAVVYVTLDDWAKREHARSEDFLSLYKGLSKRMTSIEGARVVVLPPPPIQGLGAAGGFQMQVELTDGSFDYAKLQRLSDAVVARATAQLSLQHVSTSFRSQVPQLQVKVDRARAEMLGVTIGDAFDTLQSYLGSTFVNQFTKFGHTFPVFVQADAANRLTTDDLEHYQVRNVNGQMTPIGAFTEVGEGTGPAVISLYNLYPSALVNGIPAGGVSSGQALQAMQDIAKVTLPSGAQYEWTTMAYQEKLAGSAVVVVFALALTLVYFVLAGQYGSWITPFAVILAVPLALLGIVVVLSLLSRVGLSNNLYTQIGIVLLMALSAKNAILIVEVARERFVEGQELAQAAIDAARVRFRPIVMTSLAFMLGVLPLVFASGAGANARKSIGIAVFSGMLASTCLAVLFVPAFFVVLQRLAAWRRVSSKQAPTPTPQDFVRTDRPVSEVE